MTRAAPALTLLLMLGPIGAGLLGTVLPAFGYLPALGSEELSLAPWRALLTLPGLAQSILLTLMTGFAATVLSLGLVLGFLASAGGAREVAQRLVAPLVAVPHAALALGLAFLITPSGWIMRWIAPLSSALDRPPDYLLPGDPWGLALILGLVLKETPFLLLLALAAEAQARPEPYVLAARTLGYRPIAAWIKAALPPVYRRMRLPVYAALAYSLSVVDMALVLGPGSPAPLAVELFRLFRAPDLSQHLAAAAGAVLLLLLVAGAIGVWALAARAVARAARGWLAGGARGALLQLARPLALGGFVSLQALAVLALLAMALWSVALRWRYPALLPEEWGFATWLRQAPQLALPVAVTLATALAAAGVALALTLGCLENEARRNLTVGDRLLWLLYLPLLVPQIAFLFGLQVLLAAFGQDGSFLALAWSHLVFVLPYVFLTLADSYRGFDERYARTARGLGAAPLRVLWRIKLPMLRGPILLAAAIGFAVSVAQYLPTLFAGGGRYATLTTEALALAGGNDRRVIGVYALLQAALPLLAFVLAGLTWRRAR